MAQENNKEYKVVNGNDSVELVLKDNGVNSFFGESEQIEYNSAFVFKLKDGKVFVTSGDGLIGVLFNNQTAFQKALNEKKFPVEDPPSIFAKERDTIILLNENLNNYLGRIGLTFADLHKKDVLTDISERINQNLINKNDGRALIAVGILVGEILRLELKGEWRFDKVASLNPYFIPYVFANKKSVLHWKIFFDHMKKDKVSLVDVKDKVLKYHW